MAEITYWAFNVIIITMIHDLVNKHLLYISIYIYIYFFLPFYYLTNTNLFFTKKIELGDIWHLCGNNMY